jgi:hypothetical protein
MTKASFITTDYLRAAVRARGIFAVPTKAGERGPVLLASLGLNLRDPSVLARLFELHRAGEIELHRVSISPAARDALEERAAGVEFDASEIVDPTPIEIRCHGTIRAEIFDAHYNVLVVEAEATAGDTNAWCLRAGIVLPALPPPGPAVNSDTQERGLEADLGAEWVALTGLLHRARDLGVDTETQADLLRAGNLVANARDRLRRTLGMPD